MRKKMLIVGAVLAAFLMLMIPNISAVNEQVSERSINEKINMQKLLPKIEWNFPLISIVVLIICLVLAAIFSGASAIFTGIASIFTAIAEFLTGAAGIGAIIGVIFVGLAMIASFIKDLLEGLGISFDGLADLFTDLAEQAQNNLK